MKYLIKKAGLLGAGVTTVVLLLVFPVLHVALTLANFLLHAVVLGLQLVGARLPRMRLPRSRSPRTEPFVSIHVAAHNEPPELLKETLRSLSRLSWENYEVLVIDNNTEDPNIWRPVEEYCRELGPKFRFFHIEGLSGFKAGALNYVRQYMNPRAKFIFVVDADYVVESNCLERAMRYHTDPRIGLIQFPQDYRNVTSGNVGIALDFKHFFATYMHMANLLGCVPSTGTLSLFSVEAVEAVGGFDTRVVTEDAELGLRLNAGGYRAVYAGEVIGRGLMPYDLESLKKQRWRWAFGNAQILKTNWRRILFSGELNWRQKLGFFAHLSAWFNFNLIPGLSLIVLAPLSLTGALTPMQHYVVIVSAFTLVTFMVLRFGTLFYGLRREGHNMKEIWLAFMTHIGLGWVFSTSWLRCLWDDRSPFVRTNKFIQQVVPGAVRATLIELFFGLALLVAALMLLITDYLLGPLAALLLGVARFAIYWIWLQAERTGRITREMFETAVEAVETVEESAEEPPSEAAEEAETAAGLAMGETT